jgi:hypothetical protein
MVVGNMGTERKMNYTIMGNAVNLASRLEGVNKVYKTWILASESTVRECGDRVLARRLDRIRVAGIREPVQLYEILELAEAATQQMKDLTDRFHAARNLFEARDWAAAETAFVHILGDCPDDGPSQLYLERCRLHSVIPPNKNWDGIFSFNEKIYSG